ncbi:MAG: hypothetical protein LBU32_29905 [Clostridiales bacterium]|nr:hypothetical protein [Clostridiales bacterium]
MTATRPRFTAKPACVARSESYACRDLCVDYKVWGLTDAELDSIAACTGSRRNWRVSTHVSQLENEGDWA